MSSDKTPESDKLEPGQQPVEQGEDDPATIQPIQGLGETQGGGKSGADD